MSATKTVYWRYKVSWGGVFGYADNGVQLDSMIADALSRFHDMDEITIEVIFGGSTAA